MENTRSTEGNTSPSSCSMFTINGQVIFTGGNYANLNTVTNAGALNNNGRVLRELFKDHVALNITHDTNDFVRPRCHPNTRISVLRDLTRWMQSSHNTFNVLLLYGPSGVGKTAIMVSFAEILSKEKKLAAGAFIRPDYNRNLVKTFIPSIAFQVAFSIPEVQPYIIAAIDNNPFIFNQTLETQMEQLLVGPILSLQTIAFQSVILIDSLDGYPEEQNFQCRIIGIIGNAAPRLLGKLKFLISTRPVEPLCKAFQCAALQSVTKFMNIRKYPSLGYDVRTFLRDSFQVVGVQGGLASYPQKALLESLALEAEENFVFALELIKNIRNLTEVTHKKLPGVLAEYLEQYRVARITRFAGKIFQVF